MAFTCVVQKCSNGGYWLNKWKRQLCDRCGCKHMDYGCKCDPPFRLFPFPTKVKNPEQREKWKQLIGRQNESGKKLWSPTKDSRVCSKHFIDGEPTMKNSLPTLRLGYEEAKKREKRMSHFGDPKPKKPKVIVKDIQQNDNCIEIPLPVFTEDPEIESLQNDYSFPWLFALLVVFLNLCLTLSQQRRKISSLSAEIINLKAEIRRLKGVVYTEKILKTDDDVNFYTGLPSKSMFCKLHTLIFPYVNRRWTGVSSMCKSIRNYKKDPLRFGPCRKMTSKSEFLMILMKLRLGLLGKDLAKRFDISETLCSRIFLAWLRACCIVLKPSVYLPDQESLIASKPERFRTLPDLHSIIDCTEIFIETPKDLFLQCATWSDYKHHNTVKILIACSPNSSIIFVSPAYTGRISDKALTLDCGYLDKLPQYSMIMADKGFNITDECNERNLSLYVPPGKRGQSQMSRASVEKTKRIANHRILVEQVIRRLKTFRILANEIPLSLIGHIDEITSVCSALCNFKEPIYKV